jgi:hypothetical protein
LSQAVRPKIVDEPRFFESGVFFGGAAGMARSAVTGVAKKEGTKITKKNPLLFEPSLVFW